MSFLYFHWLFPLSARETSSGNRSIYKSTRKRVDSKGLYGRCKLLGLLDFVRSTFLLRFSVLPAFFSKFLLELTRLLIWDSGVSVPECDKQPPSQIIDGNVDELN